MHSFDLTVTLLVRQTSGRQGGRAGRQAGRQALRSEFALTRSAAFEHTVVDDPIVYMKEDTTLTKE